MKGEAGLRVEGAWHSTTGDSGRIGFRAQRLVLYFFRSPNQGKLGLRFRLVLG